MDELVSKLAELLGEASLAPTATSFHCGRMNIANSLNKKGCHKGHPYNNMRSCGYTEGCNKVRPS
jgi:hypothetical protein